MKTKIQSAKLSASGLSLKLLVLVATLSWMLSASVWGAGRFVDDTGIFQANGDSSYTEITINGSNQTFAFYVAADHSVQAAIFSPSQLPAFLAGQAFSSVVIFDNNFGSLSVTLAPGDYVVGIRNTGGPDNTWRLELDETAKYPPVQGSTFHSSVLSDARYVASGQRQTLPFTVVDGASYTVDGVNSGLDVYVLPQSEVANFTSGRNFKYFESYGGSDKAYPGFWHLNLPPGSYSMAFRNTAKKPKAVVTSLLRWNGAPNKLALLGNANWQISDGQVRVDLDGIENRKPVDLDCRIDVYHGPIPYVPYVDSGYIIGSEILNTPLSPGQKSGPLSFLFEPDLPPLGDYYTAIIINEWIGGKWVPTDWVNFGKPVRVGLRPNGTDPNAGKIIRPSAPAPSGTPDPITVSIRFNRNTGNPELDNAFWNELINSEGFYNLFTPPMPPPSVTRSNTAMTLSWTNVTDAALTNQEFLDILREFARLANSEPAITYAGTYEIVGDTAGQQQYNCPTKTPTLLNLNAVGTSSGYIEVSGIIASEGPIEAQTCEIYRSTSPSFATAKKLSIPWYEQKHWGPHWVADWAALEQGEGSSGNTVWIRDKQVTPGTTYYYWVRIKPHDFKLRVPRSPLEMTPTWPGQIMTSHVWKSCRYGQFSAWSNMASGTALPGTGVGINEGDKSLNPQVSSGHFIIGYRPGSSPLASPSALASEAATSPSPSVRNDVSWLTVTPNTSNNTLNIQFAANPGNKPRTGTFMVDGEAISVTQDGPLFPDTQLRPSKKNIEASAGSFLLDIRSNTTWSITDLPSWITTDASGGTGDAKILFRYEANPFKAQRSAHINVNDKVLVLSQKGGVLVGTFVGINDASTGHISLNLTASGNAVATVQLGFEKVTLRGRLQGQTATLIGTSPSGEALTLTVPMISATGSAFSVEGVQATLTSNSRNDTFVLHWSGAYGPKNLGSWASSNVFTIDVPGWPHQGVANVTIDLYGNYKLAGKLPDGTPFQSTGKMVFQNRIIFHAIVKRRYHPDGDLAIAATLNNYDPTIWSGTLSLKPKLAPVKFAGVNGEPFVPSKHDGHLIHPVYGWGPNAIVSFKPSGLEPKPVDRLISLTNSGPIGFSPIDKQDLFTFTVDRVAGTFRGTFSAKSPLAPGSGYITGVFLQGSYRGVGFYVGPSGAGAVEVNILPFADGTIAGTNRLHAVSGKGFTHQVSVPFAASSYSLQGALPPGLSFDANSGAFSGIASGTGIYYLIVSAQGSGGEQASRLLRLDLQPHLIAQSGTYFGLVGEPTPRQETSGKLQVTLSKTWSFTASMVINGTSHAFKGALDSVSGTWNGAINSRTGKRFSVSLTLLDRGASSQITGQVTEPTLSMHSGLVIDRQSFDKLYDKCEAQGYYTFNTSAVDGNTAGGSGFGSMTIQADGRARLVGTAGDGTRWTMSTVVARHADGLILPLYVNPYANKAGGTIYGDAKASAGEISFVGYQPDNTHHVHWWKSPNSRDKLYPSGFGGPINMNASIYRQPAPGSSLFAIPSGQLVFSNANGYEHERTSFQLIGNRILMQGSNRLSITVNLKTGLFVGTYLRFQAATRKERVMGAIDRETSYGSGQWLTPEGPGLIIFAPR